MGITFVLIVSVFAYETTLIFGRSDEGHYVSRIKYDFEKALIDEKQSRERLENILLQCVINRKEPHDRKLENVVAMLESKIDELRNENIILNSSLISEINILKEKSHTAEQKLHELGTQLNVSEQFVKTLKTEFDRELSKLKTELESIKQNNSLLIEEFRKVRSSHEIVVNEIALIKGLDLTTTLQQINSEISNVQSTVTDKCGEIDLLRNETRSVKIEMDSYIKSRNRRFNETCYLDIECREGLTCIHNQCGCQDSYWNGSLCRKGKGRFNETCYLDIECREGLTCIHNQCGCQDSYWNGSLCVKAKECADIDFTTDGLYFIYPVDNHPVKVNCVIREGIKWTVFQRRTDGSVTFDRKWAEYRAGFGDPHGEFWLGNNILHLISSNNQHRLRVELTKEGQNYYAVYSNFLVESESVKYRLNVTGYYGNAGDSLTKAGGLNGKTNGMMFSTRNNDNDIESGNCAAGHRSGWWYSKCYTSQLNKHPGSWGLDLGWETIATSLMMITKA